MWQKSKGVCVGFVEREFGFYLGALVASNEPLGALIKMITK